MWFDAFLHARSLSPRDLSDLRFFGVTGALVPSGDDLGTGGAASVRRGWQETAAAARRLRKAGLAAWAAVGIHPRRIPARGLEALLAELPGVLGQPEVAALGTVGLEEGTPLEERVLLRQLTLAVELRLPVILGLGLGLGVPGRRREAMVRRTLALLQEAEVPAGQALVAGADARTVRAIRAFGQWAGLSLSQGEDGVAEAVKLIAALGPEGIVLGSGAGLSGGDLLALPRAADRLAQAGLSVGVVRRVCAANAIAFLRVDPSAVPGRGGSAATRRSGRRASR